MLRSVTVSMRENTDDELSANRTYHEVSKINATSESQKVPVWQYKLRKLEWCASCCEDERSRNGLLWAPYLLS